MIDNRIESNGSLANLAVANDELTLAAANGDHRVDSLEARLQRLLDGLAENHARGLAVERQAQAFALDGSLAVDGLAQDVDDASHEAFTHGDRGDAACALHGHALRHRVDLIEQDNANVAFLEVHGHASHTVFKLNELVGFDIVEAVDVGHAVAHVEHSAHLLEGDLALNVAEFLFQYFRYFTWVYHLTI